MGRPLACSNPNHRTETMIVTSPAYREQIQAAKAEASAQREAESKQRSTPESSYDAKSTGSHWRGEGWHQAKGQRKLSRTVELS